MGTTEERLSRVEAVLVVENWKLEEIRARVCETVDSVVESVTEKARKTPVEVDFASVESE